MEHVESPVDELQEQKKVLKKNARQKAESQAEKENE